MVGRVGVGREGVHLLTCNHKVVLLCRGEWEGREVFS